MEETTILQDCRQFFTRYSVEIVETQQQQLDGQNSSHYLVRLVKANAYSRTSRQAHFDKVLEKLQPNQQEQLYGLMNKNSNCGVKVKLSLLLAIKAPIESLPILYKAWNARVPMHLPSFEFCFRADAVSVVLEQNEGRVGVPSVSGEKCDVEFNLGVLLGKRNTGFPQDLEKFEYQGSTEFRTEAECQEVRKHIASEQFGANEVNGLRLIKGVTSIVKKKKAKRIRWHCTHKNTGLCPWICEEIRKEKDDGNFDFSFFRIGLKPHSGHDKIRKRGLPAAAKALWSSSDMTPTDLLKKCRAHGIELSSDNHMKQLQCYVDWRRRSQQKKNDC